jgi:hypothetical protein
MWSYLGYSNVEKFLAFVDDVAGRLFGNEKVNAIYAEALAQALRFVPSDMIRPTLAKLRTAAVGDVSNEELQRLLEGDSESFVRGVAYLTTFAEERLREAAQWIPGQLYPLLEFAYCGCEREVNILGLLRRGQNHRVDFHALMRDPAGAIKDDISFDNFEVMLSLLPYLGVDTDDVLIHLMTKMDSKSYGDYSQFVARLSSSSGIDLLLRSLALRLSGTDLDLLFDDTNRFVEKEFVDVKATIRDLCQYGLLDFIEFLHDPRALVTNLWRDFSLQEKLGHELRRLARTIAARFSLDSPAIERDIVLALFKEPEPELTASRSMFTDFIPERNFQSAFFIIMQWKPSFAIETLTTVLTSSDATCGEKAKAFSCLSFFEATDCDETVCYYNAVSERFGLDRTRPFVDSVLEVGDPQAICELMKYCIDQGIDNHDLVLRVISDLKSTFPRFLLRYFMKWFEAAPIDRDDSIFSEFEAVLAMPFEELLTGASTPSRAQQTSVFRDVFNAISQCPRSVDRLKIMGEVVTWSDVAARLCHAGAVHLAAELGAHLTTDDHRNQVLLTLMKYGHFDIALQFGYDPNQIFEFIRRDRVVQATQTLIDLHFTGFTSWLKAHKFEDTLLVVEKALAEQGRTCELKRMRQRLARVPLPA